MVQAWPMPFRVLGAGVLGPRPAFQPQQAMVAQFAPPPAPTQAQGWDHAELYSALQSTSVATQPPPSSADWFMDTGATTHMTSSSGNLPNPRPLPFSTHITVGNGAKLPATHTGAVTLPTSPYPLNLPGALVSPSLIYNLVSVRKLTRDNPITVEFDSRGFSVKDLSTKMVMLRCESADDLYKLRLPQHHALTASASIELWHAWLGHPGTDTLRQLLHNSAFTYNKSVEHVCSSYHLGKHTRLPFSTSKNISYNSDFKYYVVLLDDFTHYIWTSPMRVKSEVLPIIRSFHTYTRTQFQLPVLALQTDNGREFDSSAMRTLLDSHGTQFRLSCLYTSQQNGKAEWILRMINDCAEALNTATYLINRQPCRATGTATPHELLLGIPPNYNNLRTFGYLCYPNTAAVAPHKLYLRSMPCVFLGYPADHRGYRCLDTATRKVITSRHVVFDETQFPFHVPSIPIASPPPPPPPTYIYEGPVLLPAANHRDTSVSTLPIPAATAPLTTLATPTTVPSTTQAASPTASPPTSASSQAVIPPSTTAPAAPGHHMVTWAQDDTRQPSSKYAGYALAATAISPVPTSVHKAL
ncbi:hypothetical protein U9M48_002857 [Paspalum notatum var. saurae]|uniref:Integrase catalytic domain-containing protein n=1 Tax=Paspalum notatum var. saurae TaxID=547442 RepID=A0AAQ3PLU8_PASNO